MLLTQNRHMIRARTRLDSLAFRELILLLKREIAQLTRHFLKMLMLQETHQAVFHLFAVLFVSAFVVNSKNFFLFFSYFFGTPSDFSRFPHIQQLNWRQKRLLRGTLMVTKLICWFCNTFLCIYECLFVFTRISLSSLTRRKKNLNETFHRAECVCEWRH